MIRVGESTFELVVGPPASLLYDDELIRPWYEHAREVLAPGARRWSTSTGTPASTTRTASRSRPSSCLATLEAAGARGVVMPMHEPDGYPPANDRVHCRSGRLGRAADRVLPPRPEARRRRGGAALPRRRRTRDQAASAGRGLRALRDPEVEPIFALAHERRLPLVIHAGRGIPTLARDAVDARHALPGGADRARPRGDLRPQLALAGDPAPPEPPDRHRLVAPGRPRRAVRARAAGTARLRQRPPLLHALHVGDDGRPLRPAGRSLAGAAGRNPRAAGRTAPRWRRAARPRGRTWT